MTLLLKSGTAPAPPAHMPSNFMMKAKACLVFRVMMYL